MLLHQEHDGNRDWDPPTTLYPEAKADLGLAVPRDIAAAYGEARSSFDAGAFTACAIMCRKVLEGTCKSLLGKDMPSNLAKGLEALQKLGLIDPTLLEWSTQLRIVGNEAAHDTTVTVDRADADDVLVFSEALVEYIFTYKQRFEAFKKRQDARKAAAAKSSTKP